MRSFPIPFVFAGDHLQRVSFRRGATSVPLSVAHVELPDEMNEEEFWRIVTSPAFRDFLKRAGPRGGVKLERAVFTNDETDVCQLFMQVYAEGPLPTDAGFRHFLLEGGKLKEARWRGGSEPVYI